MTHPGEHLEHGETAEEGTIRECWEEARARIEIDSLIGVYTTPELGVVDIFYEARLVTANFEAGPESQDVALYARDALPWEELAFETTRWALERLTGQCAPKTRAATA